MSEQRWKWLEQPYSDLKANYNDILDDQDIQEAFNHDQPINTAKRQFKKFRCRMLRLWIAMIIGLGVFTGILYTSGKSSKEPANIVNENRTETTVGTSSEEASETDLSENN